MHSNDIFSLKIGDLGGFIRNFSWYIQLNHQNTKSTNIVVETIGFSKKKKVM